MSTRARVLLTALVLLVATGSAYAERRLSLRDLRRAGVLPARPTVATLAQPAVYKETPGVGDTRSFWTYDLSVMPPSNVAVAATCRAVGDTVLVYVADDQWESTVSADDVGRIVTAFDEATPLGEGGIMARMTELFGASSDIDANGRLIILVYEIPTYQNYTFDGYFRAEDLLANDPACETNPSVYCSNECEVIHVNSDDAGSDYMIGVMAHEYEHLIHFGLDADEEIWLDESMAELAMAVNGYEDDTNVAYYVAHRDAPLVTSGYVDYGVCMLWGAYLYNRLGAAFVSALMADTANGTASVTAQLAGQDGPASFEDLFADWALFLALATQANGPAFPLVTVPTATADGGVTVGDAGASQAMTAAASNFQALAGAYAPKDGKRLTAALEPSGTGLLRTAILSNGTVLPALLEEGIWRFDETAPGQLVVVLANPDASGSAEGTVLLSWEDAPVTTPEPGAEVADAGTSFDAGTTQDLAGGSDIGGGDTGASDGGGGDGGCTVGTTASVPSVFLLLLLLGALALRRRGATVD